MKKTILLLFVCVLSYSFGNAQIQLHDSGNHGLMRVNTKTSQRMADIKGSPYLNEDFQRGIATVEGKEPLSVFLRYNVPQEQMEIKLDLQSEEIYELPGNNKAVYKIGPQVFIHDMVRNEGSVIRGYFIQHYSGENFRLLEKPVATLTEAVKAKTGYDRDRPAEIEIENQLFVVSKDGEVNEISLKHRDIKKEFASGPAADYLDDNKIKSLEDLKTFIQFLDTL